MSDTMAVLFFISSAIAIPSVIYTFKHINENTKADALTYACLGYNAFYGLFWVVATR